MKKENLIGGGILVLCLVAIIIGICLVFSQGTTKEQKGIATAIISQKKIAVVRIYGEISFQSQAEEMWGGSVKSADRIVKRLSAIKNDPSIKAVILRINSPGGTVAATQEIYNQIKELKKCNKKVVVSIGDIGASGAYYVACPADKIVANAGSLIGSIGVIMHLPEASNLLEKIGVNLRVIKSGQHKDIGSIARPMSEEEREILQGVIDDAYGQFYRAVKNGRQNISDNRLKELADGRIFTGQQAKKAGLIDEIGDYQQTITITAQLAGIEGTPAIIEEDEPFQWLKGLIEGFSSTPVSLLKNSSLLKSPCLEYCWRPEI
ncbi:signal peptide peptidase SppA [Candidatus Desantisbacteria bacterium]|nr:signal peptide peptidase SppA [Candidatus Desantisbacteria bacterium]